MLYPKKMSKTFWVEFCIFDFKKRQNKMSLLPIEVSISCGEMGGRGFCCCADIARCSNLTTPSSACMANEQWPWIKCFSNLWKAHWKAFQLGDRQILFIGLKCVGESRERFLTLQNCDLLTLFFYVGLFFHAKPWDTYCCLVAKKKKLFFHWTLKYPFNKRLSGTGYW